MEYTDCIAIGGVKPSPNDCPGKDIKPSNGEASALGYSLFSKYPSGQSGPGSNGNGVVVSDCLMLTFLVCHLTNCVSQGPIY